jgi:hypothetical protein
VNVEDIEIVSARAEQGAWVTDIAPLNDLRLKTREAFNDDWSRRAKELREAEPAENRPGGNLLDAIWERHKAVLLAETALLDWNLKEKGEPVPFSRERALALLQDPKKKKFAQVAFAAATVVASRGRLDEEAVAKN